MNDTQLLIMVFRPFVTLKKSITKMLDLMKVILRKWWGIFRNFNLKRKIAMLWKYISIRWYNRQTRGVCKKRSFRNIALVVIFDRMYNTKCNCVSNNSYMFFTLRETCLFCYWHSLGVHAWYKIEKLW